MRLYSLVILLLLFLTSCAVVKKKSDFYCYEYKNNYKIRFYPGLSWIVHKGVEYSPMEKKALKSDIPIVIAMDINVCKNKIIDMKFIGENTMLYIGQLQDSTKQKILDGFKKYIRTEVLPIREGEEMECDTNLVVNLWIK